MSALMSTRAKKLSKTEIQQAFAEDTGLPVPPILTVEQLAQLVQIPKKTIYEWCSKGRLDGSFRKRGKRTLFWRDRAIDLIFNGPEWTT